jgi:hypothetical protein
MNDRVKQTLATQYISTSRMGLNCASDEDNATRAGLRDMNHYWEIFLSEAVAKSSFIHTLATHFFEPTLVEGQTYKVDLNDAIKFLSAADEVPLKNVPGKKEPLVMTRQVVERLLSMPKRAHLVPESLKAFMRSVGEIKGAPKHEKRQRPAPQLARVIEAMRLCPREDLDRMPEKEMEHRFSASRDTCRKARDIVLSPNVARH